jgi:cytochrome d ubiquinol oxidase subunit II
MGSNLSLLNSVFPNSFGTHEILQIIWFLLIAVLLVGYFVLDGFDLGAGILNPFVAKTDKEKALVRQAVGPVWDGNEVWLLTAGGALFAAFPPAYAASFSGFYLAIMLVLFGLIFRAVAIEYAGRDTKWKKFWNGAFFLGSFVPALLFGAAIGNVIQGVALGSSGSTAVVGLDYVGGFFSLLNPFALLCAIMGLVTFIAMGAAWLSLKSPKESLLRQRAMKARSTFNILQLVVFVLVSVWFFVFVYGNIVDTRPGMIIAFVFAGVCALGWVLARVFIQMKKDQMAFLAGCLIPIALVGITAASIFPFLIPAADNPAGVVTYFIQSGSAAGATEVANSINIFAHSSSQYTLTAMLIITCIGLPLVLIYHIVIYRVFRGRVKEEDAEVGGY